MLVWVAARKEAKQIRHANNIKDGQITTERLEQLCASLFGATVEYRDLKPEYSGLVVKDEYDTPKIYIAKSDSPQRQRFTLAHELGHLVDRLRFADDHEFSFVEKRSWHGQYDFNEFFADEFAGALLMPEDELRRLHAETDENWYAMALHFNVTVQAVMKRWRRIERTKDDPALAEI